MYTSVYVLHFNFLCLKKKLSGCVNRNLGISKKRIIKLEERSEEIVQKVMQEIKS